jgi:hypothetical protein
MTLRHVPRSEWRSFLHAFSRSHRAWLATIHGFVGEATVTHIPSVALKSVTLDDTRSDSVVRITFINGISLCAARPCVLCVQSDNGAERALEIETAEGGFIRLAFRATVLPEQLDGVAPAELIPDAPV